MDPGALPDASLAPPENDAGAVAAAFAVGRLFRVARRQYPGKAIFEVVAGGLYNVPRKA